MEERDRRGREKNKKRERERERKRGEERTIMDRERDGERKVPAGKTRGGGSKK